MNRRSIVKLLSGLPLYSLPFSPSFASLSQKRVILLELSGANDGLNTVVPFKDERYHELRPSIGLNKNQVITLDDDFGFNNALYELMPLWENGDLSIVHGLGYPNANRSHFKSIALWETGSDGNKERRDGWITHDIEHAYAISKVDAHGVSLGGGMGVFKSTNGNWLSMKNVGQFAGRSIKAPARVGEENNKMLKLLVERAIALNASLDRIASKVQSNPNRVKPVGSGDFYTQIANAINLINSGIDVPVVKVTLGGFDTHENQLGRHTPLLKQLAKGLGALQKELRKTDNWNNTVILSYSEFGRRAEQNLSKGTDHGTAAAHFVIGGGVNGGFHGKHPDLGTLQNGDLQFTNDYRALYCSLIEDWFDLPSNAFQQYRANDLMGLFT